MPSKSIFELEMKRIKKYIRKKEQYNFDIFPTFCADTIVQPCEKTRSMVSSIEAPVIP